MSLVPPGTTPSVDVRLYASVQVAVTSAALYDHALALGREVELIWMKPLTLVTLLYVIERYLGDIVLIVGLCLCLSTSWSEEMCVSSEWPSSLFKLTVGVGIRLFQVRAWGALVYAWATQATMQLRLYAMYRRSSRILALLLTFFFCEIAAIAFIIWRAIGPDSSLQAMSSSISGKYYCTFYSFDRDFMYIFIPFLCFEFFLFVLAARIFVENVKQNREADEGKGLRVNFFMNVLARDGICYFFINLVACVIVLGSWQGIPELYANLCIPFVMFFEVLVGTRLILNFRERYARSDEDPVLSGRFSSLHFREDERVDSTPMSIRCQVETIVV